MVPPIMSAEKPSLAIALKTLWGAAEMPFGDACAEPYRHPSFEELTRRLQQLCEIGASGLLHGPNGIGKSYLCGCFTDKLPEKRYKILVFGVTLKANIQLQHSLLFAVCFNESMPAKSSKPS